MEDKRFLSNQLKQIPIYSNNQKCGKTLFSMINNDFDYSPTIECIYQSNFSAEKTTDLYNQSLISNNWSCFDESIYADWYDIGYLKDGLILNILFFTNGKVEIRFSQNKYSITSNNNSCVGASIEYSKPYRDKQGLQYTPPSHWVINQ